MPEAHNIASAVGSWVSGLVVWVVTVFTAAKVRHTPTSSDKDRNDLLKKLKEELADIRIAAQSSLTVLRRLEQIAIEVKNESGDVVVIQRRPRASITGQHVSI